MKITIQYFKGCRHWATADARVQNVIRRLSRSDVIVERQRIESAEQAARIGFRGSPTILVNGRDPFATGAEPIGLSCRVYATDQGREGSPTENQLSTVFAQISSPDRR